MSSINASVKVPAESKPAYVPELPYPQRKVQLENQGLEQKQKKKVEVSQCTIKPHVGIIK